MRTTKTLTQTTLLTLGLSAAGFSLLHFNFIGFGFTFFVLVPLSIGYFLGQRPTWKSSWYFGILMGIVAFFYLLFSAQLEGLFCIITLSPLFVLLLLLGSEIGYNIRRWMERDPRTKDKNLKISLLPILVLFASAGIEHYFTQRYDYGKVESKILLPHPPERVFDFIKSVERLEGELPLLLRLGLPVPQRCVMDSDTLGARRTCYFESGTIDERLTEIERGRVLRMEVTRYGLPGRKWLKFNEAVYLFSAQDSGTTLTRITSYRTELKPRFYWGFWERKAIEAEHEYVLRDLERRLKQAH